MSEQENDQMPEQGEWGNVKPRKVDEDIISYLQSVTGALENPEDEEQVELLIANVFEELENKEASAATNKKASLVLEKLIQQANSEQIYQVISNFKEYFGYLCFNRFSSHVVEKLLTRATVLFSNKGYSLDEHTDKALLNVQQEIVGLSKFLRETDEWWNLSNDPSGTHIYRALLRTLSGQQPVNKKRQRYEQEQSPKPEDIVTFGVFRKELQEILAAVCNLELKDLMELACGIYSSPVLQQLLQTVESKNENWKGVVNKILPCKREEEDTKKQVTAFDALAKDKIGSHVLEVILKRSKSRQIELYFNSFFRNRMVQLSSHHISNYVVQHCIAATKTTSQFEAILDELNSGVASELLALGHVGILLKLAQVGKKHEKQQKNICQMIYKGCQTWQKSLPKERVRKRTPGCVECLLRLSPKTQVSQPGNNKKFNYANGQQQESTAVHINGAQVVGALLEFSPANNRVIVENIVSMESDILLRVCLDPVGGRYVAEPLLDGPIEHSWAKQRLITKLKDNIAELAESKFGHHVIRKAFDTATPKNKIILVEEICKAQTRLKGNLFGRKTMNHFRMEQYQNHPETWKSSLEQANRKRRKLNQWFNDLN